MSHWNHCPERGCKGVIGPHGICPKCGYPRRQPRRKCECGRVAGTYPSQLVGFNCCETCAREVLEQAHRDGGHVSNEHAGECGLCDAAQEQGAAEEGQVCEGCGEGLDTRGECTVCDNEYREYARGHAPYTQQEAYDHENPPLRDDPMEFER